MAISCDLSTAFFGHWGQRDLMPITAFVDMSAPVGSFTSEVRAALVAHKPELLALDAVRARLAVIADRVGIARSVVDALPVEELEATAEQVALAANHRDRDGGSLTQSLLLFYLRHLAGRGRTT